MSNTASWIPEDDSQQIINWLTHSIHKHPIHKTAASLSCVSMFGFMRSGYPQKGDMSSWDRSAPRNTSVVATNFLGMIRTGYYLC